MNPASPSPMPVRAPLWQRFFRSLAFSGLTLAITVIAVLIVIGGLPSLRAALSDDEGGGFTRAVMMAIVLAIVFLPLGLLALAARRQWVTWRFLLVGWAVVLPVLGWLTWDEPALRHPLPLEELSPAFPGAEESYAWLMRYGKRDPGEEAQAFAKLKMQVQWAGESPREPEKWLAFVTRNRAGLEADWAALAPQRRWMEQLATYDRIGDLTPSAFDADLPTFQVWRTLSQRTCVHATLQALDGQHDEAIATLVPLLGVSRKLQVSSRTLVRTMIAVVVERMCMETAAIVLDRGPVAPATRSRLVAALGDENAPVLARRLLLIEYAHFGHMFSQLKLGDALLIDSMHNSNMRGLIRQPLNLISGLLINPNATANLYGRNVFELAALAEARELGKFSVRSRDFSEGLLARPAVKNLGGRLVLVMAFPAYDKILESHWKAADQRAALRARLAEATAQSN